ncbi:hypothetical protein N0B16_01500 [Chryseobacterium sp. GMJ5]|uniref:Bacteriocin n=1 Tax=Chryseobacterium gilvum TaxID=2976534 RepID=A0ABT2VSX9_9FLAO|nr:hypothetical protein [Chryseobacterium gilvum]MCU7613104.1 hypothetical protein [Chryseobacterium gilvum]
MKKLKKISRKELKTLIGGKKISAGIEALNEEGSIAESCYQCCKTLYECGDCSTSSNCPSGQFLRAC